MHLSHKKNNSKLQKNFEGISVILVKFFVMLALDCKTTVLVDDFAFISKPNEIDESKLKEMEVCRKPFVSIISHAYEVAILDSKDKNQT